MTSDDVAIDLRNRVRDGLSKPANWLELVRFAVVGGSGYVVNLAVYALMVHAAGVNFRIAATVAFLVAVANNFLWNRQWTFKAHQGHPGHQAARFLTVSVVGFVVNLAILELLVSGLELAEVPAQAIAIVAATPVTFLGNKLWTFGL